MNNFTLPPRSTAKKGRRVVQIRVNVARLPSTAQPGGAAVSFVGIHADLFRATFPSCVVCTASEITLKSVKMLSVTSRT